MRYWKRYYIVYVLLAAFCCGSVMLAGQRLRAVSAELAPVRPVVVIDPGHGGFDGGAVSPGGTAESALNLEISLRLRDLCALLGLQTRMLREDDSSLELDSNARISEKKVSDLRHRTQIVNGIPGAVLVSIHQNSFPQGPKYRGAQVFYADTPGSQALAELLQQAICRDLDPDNHRACKQSRDVYLMEQLQGTGILLECGFLTNAAEEALLKTPDYQKKLACTAACVLCTYCSGAG